MRLIGAETLKEVINDMFRAGEYDCYSVLKAIDNAPTVEIPTELCKGCRFLKDCETCEEKLRPQGEWCAREDMDFLDENKVVHNHFECNKCGFIHDFIDGHTSQYNFCPQCGADMQKGGAE